MWRCHYRLTCRCRPTSESSLGSGPSTSASTPQGKARFAERLRSERLLQRYIWFVLGVCINSFGVAFITKAALGTSPGMSRRLVSDAIATLRLDLRDQP